MGRGPAKGWPLTVAPAIRPGRDREARVKAEKALVKPLDDIGRPPGATCLRSYRILIPPDRTQQQRAPRWLVVYATCTDRRPTAGRGHGRTC
jgi:hypothetical protein